MIGATRTIHHLEGRLEGKMSIGCLPYCDLGIAPATPEEKRTAGVVAGENGKKKTKFFF
jgi:hypothetical protein